MINTVFQTIETNSPSWAYMQNKIKAYSAVDCMYRY